MMVGDATDIGTLLAEEAEAAEEHRDDDVPMVRSGQQAKVPAQVYSLRIPVEKLEELRRLAEQRHLTPSALMRSWVLACLEQESAGQGFLEVVRTAVREELAQLRPRSSPAAVAKSHKGGVSAAKIRRAGRSGVPGPAYR